MLLISKTLKNHFILSQLTVEEIRYVVQKMKYCTAKKGDYIFKQGDPSFSYYIILEGKCSVHIDG
jgi:CRP-like cAMP-binding protein